MVCGGDWEKLVRNTDRISSSISAMGFGRTAAGARALEEDGSAFSLFVPCDDDGSVWSGASKGSEDGSGARKRGEGGCAGGAPRMLGI